MKRIALGCALALVAVPALSQSTIPDARWSSWLGCWELVTENVRDGAITDPTNPIRELAQRSAQPSRATPPRVCVAPAAEGGVTLTTMVAGETALEQTLVADGVERPITEVECRGTQRTEWSQDAQRLYAQAELTCGDQPLRRISGLAMMTPDDRWLDIQAVRIDGRETVRIRRFRRASDQARPAGSPRATPLTLEQVKDASGKVSPAALQAALVENRARFALTGKTVVDLDEAGVDGTTIDLIVALSYPSRFVVEREDRDPPLLTSAFGDPFFGWGFPMWPYYDGLGYYSVSPYVFSPFSYSYFGRYDPRFYYIGSAVIDSGGVSSDPRPSGTGRVVDGQGYTRVRTRASAAAEPSRTRSGAASTSGGTSNTSSTSSSSGSSGGSVSSSGFSSGGGGDGGRTAVPR